MDKDLAFALQMYGASTVTYAHDKTAPMAYENMCFWQNQVWLCAVEAAKTITS